MVIENLSYVRFQEGVFFIVRVKRHYQMNDIEFPYRSVKAAGTIPALFLSPPRKPTALSMNWALIL
jgi:hypothetical protein